MQILAAVKAIVSQSALLADLQYTYHNTTKTIPSTGFPAFVINESAFDTIKKANNGNYYFVTLGVTAHLIHKDTDTDTYVDNVADSLLESLFGSSGFDEIRLNRSELDYGAVSTRNVKGYTYSMEFDYRAAWDGIPIPVNTSYTMSYAGNTTFGDEVYHRHERTGSMYILGDLSVTGIISGSMESSSFADYAISASHALVADSSSFTDYAMSSSHALYADDAETANSSTSASFAEYAFSASQADFANTASYAEGLAPGLGGYWTGSNGEIHRMSNVGIGKTNPVVPLEVSGNIRALDYIMTNVIAGSPGASLRYIGNANTTNDFWFNVPTSGEFRYAVQDVEKIIFDANTAQFGNNAFIKIDSANDSYILGNVGIGTTDPKEKLHVWNNVSASAFYGDGSNLTGISGSTSASFAEYAFSSSQADFANTASYAEGLAPGLGGLWTGSAGEIHRLSNVGIGTTNPTAPLEVVFPKTVRNQLDDVLVFRTSTPTVSAPYTPSGLGILWRGETYHHPDEEHARIYTRANDSSGQTYGTDLKFATTLNNSGSTIDRMIIRYNGNVGIGTTRPAANLHVWNGTVSASTFTGDGSTITGIISSSFADYAMSASHALYADDAETANSSTSASFTDYAMSASHALSADTITGDIETSASIWKKSGTDVYVSDTGDSVGIGTTNPETALHVDGAIIATDLTAPTIKALRIGYDTAADTGDIVSYDWNLTEWKDLDIRASDIDIQAEGTTAIYITGSTGNVGIGTTNPQEEFHVYEGASGVTPIGSVSNLVVESNVNAGIYILNPDVNVGSIVFGSPSDSFAALLRWDYTNLLYTMGSQRAGASLVFQAGSSNEVMRIGSTGNVGIGTDTPTKSLHISGSGLMLEDTRGIYTHDNNNNVVQLILINASDDILLGSSNYLDNMYFRTRDGYNTHFQDGATTNMTIIGATGFVGIGTTNPQEKLHVWGNVSASVFYGDGSNLTGIAVTGSTSASFADYAMSASHGLFAITADSSTSASFADYAISASYAMSASYEIVYEVSSSYADFAKSASHAEQSDNTISASFADYAMSTSHALIADDTLTAYWTGSGGEIHRMSNIGIGTTDPKEKLHVHGDSVFGSGDASEIRISGSIYIAAQSNTQPTVQIYNPAGYVDIVQQHLLYGFLVHRGTDWGGFGVTTGAIVQISSNTDTGDIQLCHNNFTDVRLHIDAGLAGFIGIGTTVPQAMLHVTGSGIFGGNVGIGTTDPSEKLEIYGANVGILVEGASGGVSDRSGSLILHGARDSSGEQGAFGRIYFTNADAGGAPGVAYVAIQAENVANDAGASILNFKTSDGSGVLTQAMTIDETQQVGIGTTNPVDKLHVWGNVTASNFYGNSANITGTVSASVFDSFGTYQMDSVDIIDTSGYQTGVLKTRQMLLFGRSASLSVDDANIIVDAATVDGSLNGQGYRMLRAGTVSGVSVQCDVTDAFTNGSFTITVQKNAVNQSMTVVPIITSVGDTGTYSTSNSFTIVANDRINIEMDLDVIGETGAVENISIMVEILT